MAFTAYNDNIVLSHSQSSMNSDTWMKECLDWTVAAVAVVLLAPVFLIVAAAIKLESRGPVFFRQRRNGVGGNIFNVWKFRTMSVMEDGITLLVVLPTMSSSKPSSLSFWVWLRSMVIAVKRKSYLK